MDDIQVVWDQYFDDAGRQYAFTSLVIFDDMVTTGCGNATSAVGPFYCPADRKVYLDTSFFDQLARQFGAPGDFAAAYVIAHEVGHHIQTVTGTSQQVTKLQSRAGRSESNALSVRLELQADCYAGVWAANNRTLLDEGDFAEGVRAAQSIGDDTLQRQMQGRVVPDSFTHGSADQRIRWLKKGFETGDPNACDTFSVPANQL
jgi:predicted metalloprotease